MGYPVFAEALARALGAGGAAIGDYYSEKKKDEQEQWERGFKNRTLEEQVADRQMRQAALESEAKNRERETYFKLLDAVQGQPITDDQAARAKQLGLEMALEQKLEGVSVGDVPQNEGTDFAPWSAQLTPAGTYVKDMTPPSVRMQMDRYAAQDATERYKADKSFDADMARTRAYREVGMATAGGGGGGALGKIPATFLTKATDVIAKNPETMFLKGAERDAAIGEMAQRLYSNYLTMRGATPSAPTGAAATATGQPPPAPAAPFVGFGQQAPGAR